MDTFCLYIVFQIVDEITISPLIRKAGSPKRFGLLCVSASGQAFFDFIVAKSSKIE